MVDTPQIAPPAPPGHRLRSTLSLLSLTLALTLLLATWFLMSPPAGESYPGAIPWGEGSLLKRFTDLMSLYGAVSTTRGVEIKDFAFHLATVLGLLLLAARALVSALLPPERRTAKRAWFLAQAFLAGWVLLSLASSLWSGDPGLSRGQAALYGLALGWAVALAWSLESRDVPRLLSGYALIASVGAALCVWYFYARNPYHRPGFPIGNPNTLAACLLPAILITGAVLIGAVSTLLRAGQSLVGPRVLAAAGALVPLGWCFKLAGSRGAWVGLFVGVAGVLFLRAARRIRWMIAIALLLAGVLVGWYFSSAKQDIAMARGATIRFRVYAWRYAAVLWSQRPVSGMGAGQYPRLANAHSVGDRVLDPAAFMAELVEHAHNELFEVFAEIGLVGGVTFVAGFLATIAAASALLRSNLSPERRWLLFGLVASVIALMADAMLGPGLRLSGVPPVFFTLLGTLWAVCRSVSKEPSPDHAVTETWLKRMVVRRYGLTGLSLAAAVVAGWLALRNWSGVRDEYAAVAAAESGDYAAGLALTRTAEMHLLDPVRQLIAHKRAVDCEFGRARRAYRAYREAAAARGADGSDTTRGAAAGSAAELQDLIRAAEQRCLSASDAAVKLSRRVPNFGRAESLGAQCAELLAVLYDRMGAPEKAREWNRLAFQAWRRQRYWRPFDLTTLLKLTGYLRRYPGLTGDYIGLLRDALRAGAPPPMWHEALRFGPRFRDFDRTLAAILQTVGPYNPQTDLDALILSRAPETYRLHAAWRDLRGEHDAAAADADRAARLYEPMVLRFPELHSVALAEQAEYLFRANPRDPEQAIRVVRRALSALPVIQKQKHAKMARPYRLRLARYLLASGQEDPTIELLRTMSADNRVVAATIVDLYVMLAEDFYQRPPEQRPPVRRWLRAALRLNPGAVKAWELLIVLEAEQNDPELIRALLRDAESAGVSKEELEWLRQKARETTSESLERPARE